MPVKHLSKQTNGKLCTQTDTKSVINIHSAFWSQVKVQT